ncbi:hypothetical protein JCM10450v2_008102 [Rhodotorula kratochvilovae]
MRFATVLLALPSLLTLAAAAPTTCGARQYFDDATGRCKYCPISMMSCTSATTALSCSRGFYLTATKSCVTPSSCPQNTFADAKKQACSDCYVNDAATCKDASSSGTTSCISGCLRGTTCLPKNRLPSGHYCPDHVLTPCPGANVRSCNPAGSATSCKDGYNLSAYDTCVKCSEGEIFDTVIDECRTDCPDAVYQLKEDGAVDLTSRAMRYNYGSGICVTCDEEFAESCDATGAAVSCIPTYSLVLNGQEQKLFKLCKVKWTVASDV